MSQLAKSSQTIWQMLPINPIDRHFSPYSTISSFACETALVSIDELVAQRLVKPSEAKALQRPMRSQVDYEWAIGAKRHALAIAWSRARKNATWLQAMHTFRREQADWIEDYSLFAALADYFDTTDWSQWPTELRHRQTKALDLYREKLAQQIDLLIFGQLIFSQQWAKLLHNARKSEVTLLGDIPIFVGHHSADVWAAQEQFLLNADGTSSHVSGVPPDYFVKEGQLWGHALYDWKAMKRKRFDWWVKRFRRMFELFDAVRIDHFIGFHRFWKIAVPARNAKNGVWNYTPGEKLFATLQKSLQQLPIIAEDLGLVTPEVHALREKFRFPGMRVLQFGMSESKDAAFHLPLHFSKDSVVYPGTHDNQTINGWLKETQDAARRGDKKAKVVLQMLAVIVPNHGKTCHREFMNLGHMSVANTSIIQLQDVLGLGASARMNTPGVPNGNWGWRWIPAGKDAEAFAYLAQLTRLTRRTSIEVKKSSKKRKN